MVKNVINNEKGLLPKGAKMTLIAVFTRKE